MNKTFKAIVIAVLLVVTVLSFTACAKSNVVAKPAMEEGASAFEVTGTCTVEKTGDRTYKVYCSTNLMNGTVFSISVDTFAGENIDTQKFFKNSDGFYAEFEIPEDVKGPLVASFVVVPSKNGKQPLEVKQAYGSQLQNLTGEYVIWNTDGNCVVILSEPFEI